MSAITIDSTMREVMEDTGYIEYIWRFSLPKEREVSWTSFTPKNTVREVWNTIALWKAKYCGKKHEGLGWINPQLCANKENPCCGHPENTWLHAGLLTGGYIAHTIDSNLPHPATVILALINSDDNANIVYGWFISRLHKPDKPNLTLLQRGIRESEIVVYKEITQPFIRRVSEILRAAG